MADDKEAVWTKIEFRQAVDHLVEHGPTLDIGVARDIEDGSPLLRVKAQIDTGAERTCIDPQLARDLGLAATGKGRVRQAGVARPIFSNYFPVRLLLPSVANYLGVAAFGGPL